MDIGAARPHDYLMSKTTAALVALILAVASIARAECHEIEIESCISTPADSAPECETEVFLVCDDSQDPLAGLDVSGNFIATLEGV